MEFTTPTTRDEMYTELKKIFEYYRLRRYGYDKVELETVTSKKLDRIEKTDEEYISDATEFLAGKHTREKQEYKNELLLLAKKLECELIDLDEILNSAIVKIDECYENDRKEVEKQVAKKGLINSDVCVNKILDLTREKNQKITELTIESEVKKKNLQAQINLYLENANNVEEYFSSVHTAEINSKVKELKKEVDEQNYVIDKYNITVDEKNERYRNSIIRQKAELEIQFMQIRNGEYTRSELADMGYYKDVVDCISAFYDTLEPVNAYNEMLDDKNLVIYLDAYTQDLILIYRQRALESIAGEDSLVE